MKKLAYLNLEKLANRFEKKLIAIGAMMSENQAKEILFDKPVSINIDDDPHTKLNKLFRDKAKYHHPDKHPKSEKEDAEKKFKKINEAYQVLSKLPASELRRFFKLEISETRSDKDKGSEKPKRGPKEDLKKDPKPDKKRTGLFGGLPSNYRPKF